MKPFWRSFWASSLAAIVIGIISFLVFILFIVIISNSLFEQKPYSIKENAILHLKLNKVISEKSYADLDPNNQNLISESFGIREMKIGLSAAEKDSKVEGLLINVDNLNAGFASIEEIRNAIINFKKNSNKFVYAYSETYNQKSYYLSSIADKIYLNPAGRLDFRGLSTEIMFFKGAIEKLNIDLEIIKGPNNDFKSAVEPFSNNKMSAESKKQIQKYLSDIWGNMLSNINVYRDVSKDSLIKYADSLYIKNAQDAKNHHLVDDLIYEDELIALLKKKAKTKKMDDLNMVSFFKYSKNKTKAHPSFKKETKNDGNIAIIYAVGAIESGKGSQTVMGSETIAKAIRDAREDEDIKAIVLRVNSPGGSVLASDVMWREVSETTNSKNKNNKPLIVSMGDYAASGGYYISCPADQIFAQPSTITGSIGVFGIIPNFGPMLNEKLGITFDRVGTNEHSRSIYSLNTKLSEKEKSIIQEEIDQIYFSFINKVANARDGLNEKGVDQIARGRVWSGKDALNNNLVDQIGGLDDAINYAAKAGGINEKTIQLQFFPEEKTDPIIELIDNLNSLNGNEEASSSKTNSLIDYFSHFINVTNNINSLDRYQARLPYDIIIE